MAGNLTVPPIDTAFPVLPIRSSLYTADELLGELEPNRPGTYAETLDARTYLSSVRAGLVDAHASEIGMLRALHDHSISRALTARLEGERVVAIMGGHKLRRDDSTYRLVAELARLLTRTGLLLLSGGGPGAMEAGHLGARLAHADDSDLDAALRELADAPTLPDDLGALVTDGEFNARVLAELHAWQAPAQRLARRYATGPGRSIAIPTWHYGHEPPTPLATELAKYFQNSIRENGLLAVATGGIVFAPGRAGTLQEVFQDAAQNYYRSYGTFSPMVFLDIDEFWSKTVPVVDVLRTLFSDTDETNLLVSTSIAEITEFLAAFTGA